MSIYQLDIFVYCVPARAALSPVVLLVCRGGQWRFLLVFPELIELFFSLLFCFGCLILCLN